MQAGLGQPAPPYLVLKTKNLIRVLRRQVDQTIPSGLLYGVQGVGTRHPGSCPFPVDPHALEVVADGFTAEPARGYPLLEPDLRDEFQCPGAPRLSEDARALMQ